jgi:2-desacetyl-2-hydroxyethyl bacteriochlorophyllide A dehydrogenase
VKARAVQLAAPRRLEIVDVDVPEPKPGEALVATEFSGISGGTEVLAYRGEIDPDLPLDDTLGSLGGTFRFPFRYGYSAVGIVEGSRIDGIADGTRLFAFHPHQDAFVVGESDVVELPGEDPRLATMLPLVETALQVTLDAGPVFGQPVVVTGLGPVGVLTGALLARSDARVIGSDPLPWRREAAKSFGIEALAPTDVSSVVAEATAGRGVTLVVEASARPEVLDGALPLLAQEGVALVCSWYGTKPVPLSLGAEFHRRRLTIRSSQVSSIPAAQRTRWDRRTRLARARELLSELPLTALATHEFAFDRAADAYAALDRGDEGLIHAALRYR